jgi:hypothetical protein
MKFATALARATTMATSRARFTRASRAKPVRKAIAPMVSSSTPRLRTLK